MRPLLGWLVCAAALALVGCDGPSVTLETGQDKFTPTWPDSESVTQQLCLKLESCGMAEMCLELRAGEDVGQMEAMLQMIPDPDAFLACVNELPCDELKGLGLTAEELQQGPGGILACTEIDFVDGLQCASPTAMRVCTTDGLCREVPCATFCASLGESGAQCEELPNGIGVCGCEGDDHRTGPPLPRYDTGRWAFDAGVTYPDGWF